MKPGDIIDGKYRIEAELGEGGMGYVMAASHLALGSSVAIKVLKSDALKVPEVPRRFLREARAAGRLRNEHVVRVTDVGQLATGEPYMVMEMLRGTDLATMLEAGPLPLPVALEYVAQACAGLAEAHAMGMIHRDIKPANLFVTQRPNGAPLVKLLDFGIATAAIGDVDHKLTSTLTVMGSPSYMSPEQLRAARDVDARSDIWSLGVTLYELLSGEQPFLGPTLTALTLKIASEPHEPLQNVPPPLAAIVDRCLEKERPNRFADVAELTAALAPLFPNGHLHAEMVAGTLGQPVAPALHGVESSAAISAVPHAVYLSGSAPVVAGRRPSSPRPAPTTTDLTAGESAPRRPGSRRRAVWLVLGAAMAGSIVTAGIVLSQRSTSSAAPAASAIAPAAEPRLAPAAAATATATSLAPAPTPAPAAETAPPAPAPIPAAPAPAPIPAAPAAETAPLAPGPAKLVVGKPPVKRPAAKRPAGKPELKPPARDPRAPIEPPDYTKPAKEPARTPAKDPPREPVKKPCAPTDPACGL